MQQPGWYRDPAGAPIDRWWDGARWTVHTQAAGAAAYQAEMIRLARRGAAAGTLARVILGALAGCALLVLLLFVVFAAAA